MGGPCTPSKTPRGTKWPQDLTHPNYRSRCRVPPTLDFPILKILRRDFPEELGALELLVPTERVLEEGEVSMGGRGVGPVGAGCPPGIGMESERKKEA